MRYQSKKRAKLMREWGKVRAQFVLEAGSCWICGKSYASDCHEMTRGIHRDGAISERIAWLAACWKCNCFVLTDASIWPLERQLAIKWINDRAYFDIHGVCRLRGRQPGAITMADVVPWICRELDGGRLAA